MSFNPLDNSADNRRGRNVSGRNIGPGYRMNRNIERRAQKPRFQRARTVLKNRAAIAVLIPAQNQSDFEPVETLNLLNACL
jgi:hypothetical protein